LSRCRTSAHCNALTHTLLHTAALLDTAALLHTAALPRYRGISQDFGGFCGKFMDFKGFYVKSFASGFSRGKVYYAPTR
jgi:hypothetical protein